MTMLRKPPGIDLVWTWRYGNTQSFLVTFLMNGNALNITGFHVYFMVKSDFGDADADALISKDVSTHTTPASGITNIVLTAADVEELPVRNNYVFELKFRDPATGEVKTGTVGLLNIEQVVKTETP